MTAHSSTLLPESPRGPQVSAPAEMATLHRIYWAVRREFWESRSLYIAPLAVAGLALAGFVIATLGRAMATADPAQREAVLTEPTTFVGGLIMATTTLVGLLYSVDALYGERRDRSILFWKSLPVSDLETVLAKASIPIVILPLLTFAITFLAQWIMLLLSSAVLLGSGLNVATAWSHVGERWLALLYHLVTLHSLWHAPIYAWLLLVSAWARRAPFLWAVLPPVVLSMLERIAFGTTYFGAWLGSRFAGGPESDASMESAMYMTSLTHLTPGRFLSSPGLWLGLAAAAAFLVAAARLRRNREPV